MVLSCVIFLRIRRPPRSTRADTLFPYTTLFRSHEMVKAGLALALFGGCQKFVAEKNKIPVRGDPHVLVVRSEEHTSELQSLMRNSYAGFCLKKNISENMRMDIPTAPRSRHRLRRPDAQSLFKSSHTLHMTH